MSAHRGSQKVALALRDMPGLRAVVERRDEFGVFNGLRVLGCITVTPETAALVMTLAELGADVRWCSDNQFASDDDVVEYLRTQGIPVFAKSNMTVEEYYQAMGHAHRFPHGAGPAHVIDDGADITSYLARTDPEYLRMVPVISEQTTCGVVTLRELHIQGRLPVPAININDSFVKKHFDNFYGVQESLLRGLMTATGMQLTGKHIAVFGYGAVGRGAAMVLRAIGCRVDVVERDLLRAVQAHFDGFMVIPPADAVTRPDVTITATGYDGTISADLIDRARDGLVLCNIGHGDAEYDVAYLRSIARPVPVNDFLEAFQIDSNRTVYSLCRGALTNLIAGRGNPPAIMSLTFTLHLLAHRAFLRDPAAFSEPGVHRLPRREEIDCAELNHPELVGRLYRLTPRSQNSGRGENANV